MDKEKFMQFVSKAFDQGASFEISFFSDLKFTEELAKKIAEEFSQIVGKKVDEAISDNEKSRWYKVRGKYNIAVFHEQSDDGKYLKTINKSWLEM